MIKMMQHQPGVLGVKEDNIWIYLCNLMATDMIEYGRVLPMPTKKKLGLKVCQKHAGLVAANPCT